MGMKVEMKGILDWTYKLETSGQSMRSDLQSILSQFHHAFGNAEIYKSILEIDKQMTEKNTAEKIKISNQRSKKYRKYRKTACEQLMNARKLIEAFLQRKGIKKNANT